MYCKFDGPERTVPRQRFFVVVDRQGTAQHRSAQLSSDRCGVHISFDGYGYYGALYLRLLRVAPWEVFVMVGCTRGEDGLWSFTR